MRTNRLQSDGQTGPRDRLVIIASVVFGALTLVILALFVAAALFGYPLPPDSRFPLVAFLSLGAALSSAFIGGTAAARGEIPIPTVQHNPLTFSVVGGAAVLVIVLYLGNKFFPTTLETVRPRLPLPGTYNCAVDVRALSNCRLSNAGGGGLVITFSVPEETSSFIDRFQGTLNGANECFTSTLVNSFGEAGLKTESLGGTLDHVCPSGDGKGQWEGIWRSPSGREKVFVMIRSSRSP